MKRCSQKYKYQFQKFSLHFWKLSPILTSVTYEETIILAYRRKSKSVIGGYELIYLCLQFLLLTYGCNKCALRVQGIACLKNVLTQHLQRNSSKIHFMALGSTYLILTLRSTLFPHCRAALESTWCSQSKRLNEPMGLRLNRSLK